MSETCEDSNCSICYEEINAKTGKVGLGCSHEFHFTCITTWFVQQRKKDLAEVCPLCRQESGEKSKLPEECVKGDAGDEDDEEYDEDEDYEEYDERSFVTNYFLAQFVDKAKIATKIQALWRGYLARQEYEKERAAEGLLKLAGGIEVELNESGRYSRHSARYNRYDYYEYEEQYDHAGEVCDFDY